MLTLATSSQIVIHNYFKNLLKCLKFLLLIKVNYNLYVDVNSVNQLQLPIQVRHISNRFNAVGNALSMSLAPLNT